MVGAIIIAPITNKQMRKDLNARGIKTNNKLLLRPGPIIVKTVYNVLNSGVEECILVLRDSADQIKEVVLENVRDDRLKIVNAKKDDEISEIILKGIYEIKSGFCLCIAGDQPAVTPDTLKNLINEALNNPNSPNIISFLVKRKFRLLNSIKDNGMPLVAHTDILKKYLTNKKSDLNPILKEIKKVVNILLKKSVYCCVNPKSTIKLDLK